MRTLVNLHGGTVVARSEGRGMGSEFEVSLPAVVGQAVEPINLVALTGYGTSEQRAKAVEAGFDVHPVKPFEPLRLEGLLNKLPVLQQPGLRIMR